MDDTLCAGLEQFLVPVSVKVDVKLYLYDCNQNDNDSNLVCLLHQVFMKILETEPFGTLQLFKDG